MGSFLKKTIDIGGYVTTVWSFVPAATQTVITTALSGATAYFGYQELGIARSIFFASGVMAFGLASIFFWVRIFQMVGTFHRLTLINLYVANASLDTSKTKVTAINVQGTLRNDSSMLMFYRLHRIHHQIETVGPKDPAVDSSVIVLSPAGSYAINLATVENVAFPDRKKKILQGNFDLEIQYGPAIDDLRFMLHVESKMGIAFNQQPNSPKEYRIDSSMSFRKLEHSRVKK